MQLPDSSCEVIRTLQYYESRLLTSPWSFPEHVTQKYVYNFFILIIKSNYYLVTES